MSESNNAACERRRSLFRAAGALACLASPVAASLAWAQAWPAKPIRLLVPFPTSSPPDLSSRIVAGHLSLVLGQTVFVENKPGAIGMIAARELLRQPADGHTLLCMTLPLVTAGTLLPAQAVDFAKEVAPVCQMDFAPSILVANNELAANNVRELIALARAKSGDMSYASGGVGTPAHLAGELFRLQHKIVVTHVPYPQFAQAAPDLISGRVAYMFMTSSAAVPFVTSGKLKALGIASPNRLAALPQVPTLQEQGMGDFDTSNWNGLVAKSGTPMAVVDRLANEVERILRTPGVVKQMADTGLLANPTSPSQFGQLIAAETKRWNETILAAGIKPL